MASKTVTLKGNNGDQIHPKTKADAVFLEDGQSVESKFKTIGQGFSGSYNDLTDKPELFSGSYDDLTDKPKLFSGSYNDLTEQPNIPTALSELSDDISHRLVTDTEKNTWNNKSDFDGSYDKLKGKPTISNSVTTTSDDTIASSTAVKTAYDKATAAMPKSGGTFTGSVSAGNNYQSYSTYLLRNVRLASSDTTPSVNGQICWTYG